MKEVLSTTPVACSTLSTHLQPTSLTMLRPIPLVSNEVFGFPVGEYIVLLYTRMHVAQHVPLYPAALGSCLSTRHIEPRRPRRRKNETAPAVRVSDSLSTRLTPAAVGRTLRSCHHYTRVNVHQLQIESACCPQLSPRSLRAVSAVVAKRNRTRAVAVALAVDRLLTDESCGFRQA